MGIICLNGKFFVSLQQQKSSSGIKLVVIGLEGNTLFGITLLYLNAHCQAIGSALKLESSYPATFPTSIILK